MQRWLLPFANELAVSIEPLQYPGYESEVSNGNWDVYRLIESWSPQIDKNTLVIGWSLGGMLALLLAQRVSCGAVVTLASNVCFQGNNNWQMPTSQFDSFLKRFKRFPEKTNLSFWQLQVSGAKQPERLVALLEQYHQQFDADQTSLVDSLMLLGSLDVQSASLSCPHLSLFASADALVPISALEEMKTRFPNVMVRSVDGCHLIGEHPKTFDEIKTWLFSISNQKGNS